MITMLDQDHQEPRHGLVPALQGAYRALPTHQPISAEAIRRAARTKLRRRRAAAGTAFGVVGIAAVAATILYPNGGAGNGGDDNDPTSPLAKSDEVRVVDADPVGIERWPSSEAGDWVRGPNVVVRATVTDEKKLATGDVGDYSGDKLTERTIDLDIREIVWQGPDTETPPSSITMDAMGWITPFGRERVPAAMAGTPRLEVGEQYLMVLRRDTCDPSTPNGRWVPLGSDAVWPMEENIVGYGESEGRHVEGDPSQAIPESFEAQMLDHDLADIKAVLSDPPPVTGGRIDAC